MARFRGMNWLLLIGICVCCLSCGCTEKTSAPTASSITDTELAVLLETVKVPVAAGTTVFEEYDITMDASNTGDGYIMVESRENEKRLKVAVIAESDTYYYDLPDDSTYTAYPLQMGEGTYTVRVYEQISGSRYSPLAVWQLEVTLADPNAPFLIASQYVDYDRDSQAAALSFRLCDGLTEDTDKVDTLYRYVADTIQYDKAKAAANETGYLPDPDETLATGTGICFDYAALLAAMLRCQGIPVRLEIGNVLPEDEYHAWNLVYIQGEWVLKDATIDDPSRKETQYETDRFY